MNTDVMHEVMSRTHEGRMTFPEVVGQLMAINVESYLVDFVNGRETLYVSDGTSHTEKMSLAIAAVADEFSADGIVAAIRGAQADTIRYPEFVKRSTAAGVIAYWAFLRGRKVIYFGRKGETHTEHFPSTKQ